MILDGQVLGLPLVSYKDTKSAVEALSGVLSGMTAYATDSVEYGYYTGSAWIWLTNTAYVTTAIDLTLTSEHHWVTVTATGKRITLPAASTCIGKEYMISALANNVIVDANASELIDGALTQVMGIYDTMQIKCNGTGWVVV